VDTRCETPYTLGQNARDFFFEHFADTRWQKNPLLGTRWHPLAKKRLAPVGTRWQKPIVDTRWQKTLIP
jgi:hypothetical protein